MFVASQNAENKVALDGEESTDSPVSEEMVCSSKRAMRTVHHALYLMKPKMIKCQMVGILKKKRAEIEKLNADLGVLERDCSGFKTILAKSRTQVAEKQVQFQEVVSELQALEKKKKALHREERQLLQDAEEIDDPRKYLRICRKAAQAISPEALLQLRENVLAYANFMQLDAHSKKEYLVEHLSAPNHPISNNARLIFDSISIYLMQSLSVSTKKDFVCEDSEGYKVAVSFVSSIQDSLMGDMGKPEPGFNPEETVLSSWARTLNTIVNQEEKRVAANEAEIDSTMNATAYNKSTVELRLHLRRRMYLKLVPGMQKELRQKEERSRTSGLSAKNIRKEISIIKDCFNEESQELLEPYQKLYEVLRDEEDEQSTDPSVSIAEALYSWMESMHDYRDCLVDHDSWSNEINSTREHISEIECQAMETAAAKTELAYSLFWAKRKLDQHVWNYKRVLRKIDEQHAKIEARQNFAIPLRSITAPTLLQRLSIHMSQLGCQLKKSISKVRAFRRQHVKEETFLGRILERRAMCINELQMAHNPWAWYDTRGALWSEDKTHFEWLTAGQRCQARLRGWSRFFVGTIKDMAQGSRSQSASCTIEFDDRDVAYDVEHYNIQVLYPKVVSKARAMEKGQKKYILTTFLHSRDEAPSTKYTPTLVRMDSALPVLFQAMERQNAMLENATSGLFRTQQHIKETAATIIGTSFRISKTSHRISRELNRLVNHNNVVRKSKNRYKFEKHRQAVKIFCDTYIARNDASFEIQRIFRGFAARLRVASLVKERAAENLVKQAKMEARRIEVEFANRLREKKMQEQFVSNWRCPRCPIKAQYSQKWNSLAEIEVHKMTHMRADEVKFSKFRQLHEQKEKERKSKLLKQQLEEARVLAKIREQTRAFMEQQENEARITAKVERESLIESKKLKFNFEFQRPMLSAAKRRIKAQYPIDPKFSPICLPNRWPILRLVKDPRRKDQRLRFSKVNHRIELNSSPFRLGRGSECDVRVHSSIRPGIVSKAHCVFFSRQTKTDITPGYKVSVLDIHSTNGTFVNSKKILPGKEHELQDGDIIVFGSFYVPNNATMVKRIDGEQQNNSPSKKQRLVPSELMYQLWK